MTSNTNNYKDLLANLELGHKSKYETKYNPNLIQKIPRSLNRNTLDIKIPFYGFDLWHLYEVSWLNQKGKPQIAIGEIYVPADSEYLFESKSLKLYLNSFNQTRFKDLNTVIQTITKDLSNAIEKQVDVKLFSIADSLKQSISALNNNFKDYICLDDEDIEVTEYDINANLLQKDPTKSSQIVSEQVYSNLLKSNCLVTGQPDWGSVFISYEGEAIDHQSLLKYIISMRNHNEFHEHCVERIFTDLANSFKLNKLEVRAYYTRRGGVDINPVRAMSQPSQYSLRLIRQ